VNHNDIPIFPLPVVLFPGGYLPLRIFEQRYIEAPRLKFVIFPRWMMVCWESLHAEGSAL
jgi:hypothetical protein